MNTECLSLLRITSISGDVAANFTVDRATADVQLPADLAPDYVRVMLGVDPVSLGLGQLPIFHTLLHFAL